MSVQVQNLKKVVEDGRTGGMEGVVSGHRGGYLIPYPSVFEPVKPETPVRSSDPRNDGVTE